MSTSSRLACEWAVRSFGREHVINVPTRALRILEEAVELCQAVGVPSEKVHLCAATVYKRPKGDPLQEIGGVLLTTNILCASGMMGVAGDAVEPDDLLEKELARVLSKPPEHFAKRNQEKIDGGLDVSSPYSCFIESTIVYEPSTGKYFRANPTTGEQYEIPPEQVPRKGRP